MKGKKKAKGIEQMIIISTAFQGEKTKNKPHLPSNRSICMEHRKVEITYK
jgi:hypothetical protein